MPKGHLQGLEEYLKEHYEDSIFDEALHSQDLWNLHLHGHRTVSANILQNDRYDITVALRPGAEQTILPKTEIKFLYRQPFADRVAALMGEDPSVRAKGLQPILSPSQRYHIKNKTLFPHMKEGTVLFFTLLEGEVLRGIITHFCRYEITLHMKGGVPVTLLRHAVLDVRDKRGRCYLKSFQEIHRDWEKSPLFVRT